MGNTGPGSELSDPDDDGLPNLVEYATGKNPVLYSAPVGELIKNGNSLEFTYWRAKRALTEVSFIREFSQTISGVWSQTAGTVETILSDDGNMQQVLITTPAGIAGKRFVRLRVTRL